MRKNLLILLVVVCVWGVQAQETEAHEHAQDTLVQSAPAEPADTGLSIPEIPDSIPGSTSSPSHKKLGLIKRDYDYKKQVWLAAGMMAFMALVITSAQTWNPR